MLPVINFYGNHTLDFSNNDIKELEYYAISELRKITIPDEILLAEYDSLIKQFPGDDLSVFWKIVNWCPISSPKIPGARPFTKINVVAVGPMGLYFAITPDYIKLPSVIHERIDWYSPLNRQLVEILRSYFYKIVKLFGGDHAVYVDEHIISKYYDSEKRICNSALSAFEQTLATRYGVNKKTMFSYSHGKYPKYYIDTFTDLTNEQ